MPTIKDVALKSGVTVTTVSRVLNNRGYISEATREKVNAVMKELNYQPNEIARSLFKKKSGLIGLIIPNVGHPYFAELTQYVELHAYASGFKVILCNSYRDGVKENDYIDMLRRNQVDGIIMGSHTLDYARFLSLKMPIVTLDRFFSEDIPSVTSDNFRGGILATDLLIRKGCRKLAHISGPLSLSTQANRRFDGFKETVEKAGIPYVIIETALNRFEDDEYREKTETLLNDHPDIDGVFCSSDMIAANFIQAARGKGFRIPQDIQVVGFDDIRMASLLTPALTTIRQPIEDMARTAVDILRRMVDGEEHQTMHLLPVELIERDSTKQ